MLELTIEAIGSIATAVATIALVYLLYRTVRQLESTVTLSRIQTEYRFRPWIGHFGQIKKLENSINNDNQFEITVKNFGELPASMVTAYFSLSTKIINKNELKLQKMKSFNLGPILPNMEKRYWFFIPTSIQNEIENNNVFIILYFEYSVLDKKSGYGIISEYSMSSDDFIHREMWIDDNARI